MYPQVHYKKRTTNFMHMIFSILSSSYGLYGITLDAWEGGIYSFSLLFSKQKNQNEFLFETPESFDEFFNFQN
jgi:hypothetical protein